MIEQEAAEQQQPVNVEEDLVDKAIMPDDLAQNANDLQNEEAAISQAESMFEERKLFVGRISWKIELKDMEDYFSKYGEIFKISMHEYPNDRNNCFGFVTFRSQEGVEAVLAEPHHAIKGKEIYPNRAKVEPGIKKIFVGGLEADIPEADIKTYFEKYGKIEKIDLPFDKTTNQRRQFCFITFESAEVVDEVCKQPKQKIGNKECDIMKEMPKPDLSSMWGGFGGYGIPPQIWNNRGGRRGGFGGNSRGHGGYRGWSYTEWTNYPGNGGNSGKLPKNS